MPYKDPEKKRRAWREWYHRQETQTHVAKRRAQKQAIREAIAAAKVDHPCEDCGGSFDPVCLDFHHRDASTKLFEIGKAASTITSLATLAAELAKCDLVCANCHRLREKKLRGVESNHRL